MDYDRLLQGSGDLLGGNLSKTVRKLIPAYGHTPSKDVTLCQFALFFVHT
jgi:hypothetical protein